MAVSHFVSENQHVSIECLGEFALTRMSSQQERFVSDAPLGKVESVKKYLAKYPDRENYTSCFNETALQWASHEGHCDVVDVLLKHKADLESQDAVGDTALHNAVYGSRLKIITMLLQGGADINAQNKTEERHFTWRFSISA